MIVLPFKARDLAEIDIQDQQLTLTDWVKPEHAKALEGQPAFTVRDDEGAILMCAGAVEPWPNRWETWAFVSKRAGRNFIGVTRIVRTFLEGERFKGQRVEAHVECDFPAGHRWVKALGFQLEAERMRKFLPNGADCALYART